LIASGRAQTAPDAADPRLRGVTYAIPFEDVWQVALRLTGGGLHGWTLLSSDDHNGVIEAQARRIGGAHYDIMIQVRLDENAQTRVDGQSTARKPSTDFGTSARLLRRFFRVLDRTLARPPRRRSTAPRS
jgi:hypothetical protein